MTIEELKETKEYNEFVVNVPAETTNGFCDFKYNNKDPKVLINDISMSEIQQVIDEHTIKRTERVRELFDGFKWHTVSFQSGTQIVKSFKYESHFYVFGPKKDNETERERARYKTCNELVEYLNSGKKPEWFDGLKRERRNYCSHKNGINITAVGPNYSTYNKELRSWIPPEAPNDLFQKKIIDLLFLNKDKEGEK